MHAPKRVQKTIQNDDPVQKKTIKCKKKKGKGHDEESL